MNLTKTEFVRFENMSMVDIFENMLEKMSKPLNFYDAFEKIALVKNWQDEKKEKILSRFYTDINIDGRFIKKDCYKWALKRWYS